MAENPSNENPADSPAPSSPAGESAAAGRIRRFEAILEKAPGSLLFAQLAEAWLDAGDAARAAEVCDAGIDKHPNFPDGHYVRAKIRRAQGDVDGARAALNVVLSRHPQHALAAEMMRRLGGDTSGASPTVDVAPPPAPGEPAADRPAPASDADGVGAVRGASFDAQRAARKLEADRVAEARRREEAIRRAAERRRRAPEAPPPPDPRRRLRIAVAAAALTAVVLVAVFVWRRVEAATAQALTDGRRDAMAAAAAMDAPRLFAAERTLGAILGPRTPPAGILPARAIVAALIVGEYDRRRTELWAVAYAVDPDAGAARNRDPDLEAARAFAAMMRDDWTAARLHGRAGVRSLTYGAWARLALGVVGREVSLPAVATPTLPGTGRGPRTAPADVSLDALVRSDPSFVPALLADARARTVRCGTAGASAPYDEVLNRLPGFAPAVVERAVCDAVGRPLDAVERRALTAAAGPDAPERMRALAAEALLLSDYKVHTPEQRAAALNAYDRAFGDRYADEHVRFLRAVRLIEAGNIAAAATALEPLLGAVRRHPDLPVRRFQIAAAARDRKGIIGLYEALDGEWSPSPADLLLVSQAYEDAGVIDLAAQTTFAASLAAPEDAAIRRRYVRLLIRAGDLEKAEDHLRELFLESPDDPETLLVEARLLDARGEGRKVRAVLDRALAKAPDMPAVLLASMEQRRIDGDLKGYFADVSRLARKLPDNTGLARAYIDQLRLLDRWDDALAYIAALPAGDDPTRAALRSRVWGVAVDRGRCAEVLAALNGKTERLNREPVTKAYFGECLRRKGERQRGRRLLDEAKDAADDPDVAYLHGRAMRESGDRLAAIVDFERAVALSPQHVPALLELADIRREERAFADAERHLADAQRILDAMQAPPRRRARWSFVRARLWLDDRNPAKGTAALEAAHRLDPDDGEIEVWRVRWGYDTAARRAEGARLLRGLAARDSKATLAWYWLGHMLEQRGEAKAAVDAYETYLRVDPRREYGDSARAALERLRPAPGSPTP